MRVLIHQTQAYTCKNKLHELILSETSMFKDVEADSEHTAQTWLNNALQAAHARCKTKCQEVRWHVHRFDGYLTMYIPGLVHFSFYRIKQLP
jgi:hypothetical protein